MKNKLTAWILIWIICLITYGCQNDFNENLDVDDNFRNEIHNRISTISSTLSSDKYLFKLIIEQQKSENELVIVLCPFEKQMLSNADTSFFGATTIDGFYILFYGYPEPEILSITGEKRYRKSLFNLNEDYLMEYDPLCNVFNYKLHRVSK